MIAIDIGCARYNGDYSIERLIEEFHPDVLYGFDPNPAVMQLTNAGLRWTQMRADGGDTKVVLEQSAAWTYDGEIGYVDDGLNSWITDRTEEMRVKCFDLACFIRDCAIDDRAVGGIVLKMDAEGSEYDLLSHLMMQGVDELLKLVWVEWHSGPERAEERRRTIESEIACELAVWRW